MRIVAKIDTRYNAQPRVLCIRGYVCSRVSYVVYAPERTDACNIAYTETRATVYTT